jgi:hypothetical protein
MYIINIEELPEPTNGMMPGPEQWNEHLREPGPGSRKF